MQLVKQAVLHVCVLQFLATPTQPTPAGMEQFLKMLGVPVEEAGAQEGKVAERGEASDGGASSNASPAAGQSGVRDAIAARVAQVCGLTPTLMREIMSSQPYIMLVPSDVT
jgi:hypothetical protein